MNRVAAVLFAPLPPGISFLALIAVLALAVTIARLSP